MADLDELLVDAKLRLRKLAASLLVRKEAVEKELARLEGERKKVQEELARVGDPAGAASIELRALLSELEAGLKAQGEEHALAEEQLLRAKDELRELEGLKSDADRARALAAISHAEPGSELSPPAEDVALQNVRDHIAHLEARLELEAEIGNQRAASAAKEAHMEEALARAELERLKAVRRRSSSDFGGSGEGEGKPSERPSSAPGKKRSM